MTHIVSYHLWRFEEFLRSASPEKVNFLIQIGLKKGARPFIGDTVNTEVLKEGRPLTYRYYQEFLKGKAPATAPSYIPVK